MIKKVCSKCGVEKNLDDFGKNRYWCKQCDSARCRGYKRTHKTQMNDYFRNRYNSDSVFKLKSQVRVIIWRGFNSTKRSWSKRVKELTGLPPYGLRRHLLETFKNNYGYEWDGVEKIQIDHKKPLDVATTEKEVIDLCYYTNLQLLKYSDNVAKNSSQTWVLKS